MSVNFDSFFVFLKEVMFYYFVKAVLEISPIWMRHLLAVLSEVKFEERKSTLLQKTRPHNRILPFVTQYHPVVTNLKNVLMRKWHSIQNHSLLSEIYKEPPIISYKRGKSLKDILVKSKL